ncbi:MAG: ATP-binding protein [Pirellulales bacterium]
MVKSLRWRLQMWHAWVLLAVLSVFGILVYDLLWRSRLQQIDSELDRSAGVIMTRLRWLLPWPGNGYRPPGGNRGGGNQPGTGRRATATNDGDDRREPADDENEPANSRSDESAKEPDEAFPSDSVVESSEGDIATTEQPGASSETATATVAPADDTSTPAPPPSGQRSRRFPFPTAGGNTAGQRGSIPRNGENRRFGGGGATEEGKTRLWLPEEFLQLFESQDESRLYFVIWDHFGKVVLKSDGAPDVEYPNLHITPPDFLPQRQVRSRGNLREVVHVSRYDMDVLIGRSLRHDLAAQRTSGLFIALAGLGVLAGGLVGGWWLGLRAVRPIAAMTATAAAISAQNLDERIDASETDDELGQLATVLNSTFDRLQSAFEQQGRFTADASHELRTPLSVILAHTELALSRPRAGAEYADALAACQRAAGRMKTLLDGLLTLARFDAGQGILEKENIDLEDIALEGVELVRPLAEERGITIQAATQPVELAGDRKRLSQVLTNLLTNAIRYNHDAGRIEVGVRYEGGFALASVSNTGQGIDAEHLPHIFERFYRADAARTDGGSGLGLSICKTIVEAHGGSITVRSQPGQGTTFEVRLPGAAASVEPAPILAEEAV